MKNPWPRYTIYLREKERSLTFGRTPSARTLRPSSSSTTIAAACIQRSATEHRRSSNACWYQRTCWDGRPCGFIGPPRFREPMQGGSKEKNSLPTKCAHSCVSTEGFTPMRCANFVLKHSPKDQNRSKGKTPSKVVTPCLPIEKRETKVKTGSSSICVNQPFKLRVANFLSGGGDLPISVICP